MGSDVGFARLVDVLRARALEGGLEISPREWDTQLSGAIVRAIDRAASSPAGSRRQYALELVVFSADGRPAALSDYERLGQWWESLGGVWGGRVGAAARGLYLWSPGA